MYRVALPVMFALVAMAAPAAALDNSGSTAEKPVKEKRVCKSETGTGSIMPKRVCRTKAEWNALTEQSQGNLQRSQDVSRSTATVAGARGQ